jgi:hypothetical protein
MIDNGTIDIATREKLEAQSSRNSLDQKKKNNKVFFKTSRTSLKP